MAQPERFAHQDVEILISKIAGALSALSLMFDAGDRDRILDCGQCDGMRLLFGALQEKLEAAADTVGDMEDNLRKAKKAAEPQNAAYDKAWRLGTEYGAACAKMGEDHRQGPPPSWREYFRGWTGDEPPVADQPIYPQFHPAADADEPDALRA